MIIEQNPDVVIIATGGVPNIEIIESGSELVCSTWDIISGSINIEEDVILYDDMVHIQHFKLLKLF